MLPYTQRSKSDARYVGTMENDDAFVARLRCGDDQAFLEAVDRYGALMLRLARTHVRDDQTAHDVCQDAWLAIVQGIGRFERRSSLRSWILAIVVNQAKARARRDGRSMPFSSLVQHDTTSYDPAVPADAFAGNQARWPGHWLAAPSDWGTDPEQRLLSREASQYLEHAIDALPPAQRALIVLHDIAGIPNADICNILGISATNGRVLLHRGRAKLRTALAGPMAQGVVV
jgi:RNA polymerase sigma-70 factor, ECF subfamily